MHRSTQERRQKKILSNGGVLCLLFAGTLFACSSDSAKNRYLLAEKLWTDGKYASAVSEFEKVREKDPKSKLGMQALFRAAMTQNIYLAQYGEAVRNFKAFIATGGEETLAWEAQKQIGEILFSKTEQYDQAITHYRMLIKLKQDSQEVPEFNYRIGKSAFYLGRFDDAVSTFEELVNKFPTTPSAERAAYEIGIAFFTKGEQKRLNQPKAVSPYQTAIAAFRSFIQKYPTSNLIPEARFGIANCLEEVDQLDAAQQEYEAIKDTYPSPKVIQIKLIRIRERKSQRNR